MEECPDLKALRGYLTGGYAFNGNDADEIVAAMKESAKLKLQYDSAHRIALSLQEDLETAILQISAMRDALLVIATSNPSEVDGYDYRRCLDEVHAMANRTLKETQTEKRKCEECGSPEKNYGVGVGQLCPKCNGMCG